MQNSSFPVLGPLLLTLILTACGDGETSRGHGLRQAAPAAAVPAPAGGSADQQETADYVLTMEDVRKWTAANRNIQKIKVDEAQSEVPDDGSIDAMEAKFNAHPQLRAEIEKAGLDVRDFVVITWTLMQASFAQYAVDQGANPDSVAASMKVNPTNLKFLQEHRQELEQLQRGFPNGG